MPFDCNMAFFEKFVNTLVIGLNYATATLFDPWTLTARVALAVNSFQNKWFYTFFGLLKLFEIIPPFLFILDPPYVFSFQESGLGVKQSVTGCPNFFIESKTCNFNR